MHVLFIVLNQCQDIRDILDKMKEMGVKGATVIDSMGAGRYERSDYGNIPLIGGLMNSLNVGIVHNKTVFTVLESREQVEAVADAVEEILGGDMTVPGTGIMFSFPLDMVRGGKISKESRKRKKRDHEGYTTE